MQIFLGAQSSRRCRAPRDNSRSPDARCDAAAASTRLAAAQPHGAPAPIRPEQRAQRGRAAGAVASEQRHHFAVVDLEVHAVQDVRLAVPGLQPVEGAARPVRYSSTTADIGFEHLRIAARSPRTAPSASTAPRASTVIVSHRSSTTLSCARPSARCGWPRPADQLDHAADVLVRHALRRLVEQQQLRLDRQRGRELERALAAVGQLDRARKLA